MIPVGFRTVADDKPLTRLQVSDLRSSGVSKIDIALDSFQATKNINQAITNGETFVHFKAPDGTGVAVKVDRILHVSEAAGQ